MPPLSPLATLVATLAQARQSARHHQLLLRKSEAATRAALIDPILRALGWDTANVQLVEPEKTINTTWRADYALHNAAGKVDLLIEAKRLDSNLEKYSVVQQLLSYAFGFGVQKLLVTDGLNWHFYSDFKPGSTLADNHFNLAQDELTDCALLLVQWLDAIRFGHGLASAAPVAAETAAPPAAPKAAATLPKKPTQAKPTTQKTYHPLSTDLANADATWGKPSWLRLPDGTEQPLKSWRDILVHAAAYVLRARPDLPLPLPDKAGKKTLLIRWERPAAGLSYEAVTHQGKPAFIYTNYSAASCLANAAYLLSLLPQSRLSAEAGVAFAS